MGHIWILKDVQWNRKPLFRLSKSNQTDEDKSNLPAFIVIYLLMHSLSVSQSVLLVKIHL